MKRILAILALVLTLGGTGISTAAAHAELESSTPKQGAKLEAPPTEVVLTFGEELLENTVKVVAHAAGEKANVLDAVAEASGAVVTIPWPASAPAGAYELAYRVVSADGHPVSGVLEFSYAGGTSPSADATAAASSPAATPMPISETVTASPTTESSSTSSSSTPIVAIIIGLAIGIGIGVIVFFMMKRRSQ